MRPGLRKAATLLGVLIILIVNHAEEQDAHGLGEASELERGRRPL